MATVALIRKLRDTAQRNGKGEYDLDTIFNRELYPALKQIRALLTDADGGAVVSYTVIADQNDYSPTGHASAEFVRIETDMTRTITGLFAADFASPFRRKTYVNVGGNPLVFAYDSAASAEENRIIIPGGVDLTLQPAESADFWYDPITERVRLA